MDNNAFDEALRRVAADEKLPYTAETWTRMAARLDAHSAGKNIRGLVLPIPALRWAAAAAVIGFAVFAGWLVGQQSSNDAQPLVTKVSSSAAPGTEKHAAQETTGTAIDKRNVSPAAGGKPTMAASVRNKLASSSTRPQAGGTRKATGMAQNSVGTSSLATVAVAGPANSGEQTSPQLEAPFVVPTPRRAKQPEFHFLQAPEDARKSTMRTGFDVAGGYGYGGDVPAFSVSISVNRPVSSRLQLEGALALVGNTPDPIGTTKQSGDALSNDFNSGGTAGFGGSSVPSPQAIAAQQAAAAEAAYEDLRTRQLFVQAAPVLMYRVVGGLSAGGGVDAQRRVSTNPIARERFLNSFGGVSVPPLPQWDFGFALRADYNITKRLRFGLQYRESLRATSGAGEKAAGRDYWLFQAGYRIR